jgi:transposase
MGQRGRPVQGLELSAEDRAELLLRLSRRDGVGDQQMRYQMILALADGESSNAIARRLQSSAQTVSKWRQRYLAQGIAGLSDAPRSGRPRTLSDERIQQVVDRVRQSSPDQLTHWSVRKMSAEAGVPKSAVQRIWSAFCVKPHLESTFNPSTDPHFVDQVREVVGLYMHPPQRVVALCVHEKRQIQGPDRASPGDRRSAATLTRPHDSPRNGTSSLFAALDLAIGKMSGALDPRHRAEALIRFLNAIDKDVPADLDVHLIMDNDGTRKTEAVRLWFAKRPRFHAHFTPTSASWLNLVECIFSASTENGIKRATPINVAELNHSIRHYIDQHSAHPKPFVWVQSAETIIETVGRAAGTVLDP